MSAGARRWSQQAEKELACCLATEFKMNKRFLRKERPPRLHVLFQYGAHIDNIIRVKRTGTCISTAITTAKYASPPRTSRAPAAEASLDRQHRHLKRYSASPVLSNPSPAQSSPDEKSAAASAASAHRQGVPPDFVRTVHTPVLTPQCQRVQGDLLTRVSIPLPGGDSTPCCVLVRMFGRVQARQRRGLSYHGARRVWDPGRDGGMERDRRVLVLVGTKYEQHTGQIRCVKLVATLGKES
ncbi:hypothetical protein IWZ01DRAFT_366118 [Phyllosticta capitalensis]